MNEDNELKDLMQAVAKKSLDFINLWLTQPVQTTQWFRDSFNFNLDFQTFSQSLLRQPEKIWQSQVAYFRDALSLSQEQFNHWLEGEAMPIEDKRFSSKEWVNNPFYNLLSQHYILAAEHINCFIEQLELQDKRLARRMQFFTRQYLDALSPANFLHTNPQLLAETIRSHGKNLLLGLRNFLSDFESGSARLMIKMTDMNAFHLGQNLATTPGQVIYRNELMELIQYQPQTKKVHAIPLLIVPPWINKYYILDLSPGNSFILWLVRQGITVFVISWVNPDARYADKGLFDYLNEGPLRAIDVIQKQLKVKKVNTLGFCIGGTLLTCMLAYQKAKKDNRVQSATFLASMIDFSDPGDISVFIDEQEILRIEEVMQEKGFLDGRFMASTFNSLRANDLIWSFFIKNYLQGQSPVPFDILYWNADATNMPAKMHSQYLRWMYLHNRLIKPGKIKLNHVPLDVGKIEVPCFFVSTQKDHIAPWKTTYLGFLKMKGEKHFILGGSGHIAGIINPPAQQKYNYYYYEHAPKKAEQWLAQAKEHSGSWWPYWSLWLKKESGKLIPAPRFERLPYSGICPAPGEYVLMSYKASEPKIKL